MKYCFINSSPNKDGNTVRICEVYLRGNDYELVHLVDFKIGQYGANDTDEKRAL